MNVKSRHLDRILLIEADGVIADTDLAKLTGYINTIASRLYAVVLDIRAAELTTESISKISLVKKQYEKSKLRFLIVATEMLGADSARLREAVDSLKSAEAEKVAEVLALEEDLAKVDKANAHARSALIQVLGIKSDPATSSDDDIERALNGLQERNRQLRQLFRTMSSEIEVLEQEGASSEIPGGENDVAVSVAEAKRRALDYVRSRKLYEE